MTGLDEKEDDDGLTQADEVSLRQNSPSRDRPPPPPLAKRTSIRQDVIELDGERSPAELATDERREYERADVKERERVERLEDRVAAGYEGAFRGN